MICLKNRTFAVSQTTFIRLKDTIGSCDLLEKSYFCSIANNARSPHPRQYPVVICLKNRTFAVSQTTFSGTPVASTSLWFAWKIVLLQYRKQHIVNVTLGDGVVICLKNRTFAVSQTTNCFLFQLENQLWFAWKIVLLQYRKQLNNSHNAPSWSCDLLEKSYFCSIANNRMFRTQAYSLLWFAWKIVLLQYRKQPQSFGKLNK